MISRRRFLAITAASMTAGPARARASTQWRGHALGAEAAITLQGPKGEADAALSAARATLDRVERLFSLYLEDSWLLRLNDTGAAVAEAETLALLRLCDRVHGQTRGLFDPTVQVLWQAAARGEDPRHYLDHVDWSKVTIGAKVQLGTSQALTLNGIAQGWATDRVTQVLVEHGFTDALINIGEFRAEAGDWRIGISDPNEGLVRTARLSGGAIATSSPSADRIDGHPHIFGPAGQRAQWSTVSVEARTAALADALSTALCLAPRSLAQTILRAEDVFAVTLVADNGDISVLR